MNAINVIIFINMQMKNKYNSQHTFLFFKIEDFIKLHLHKSYNVLNIKLRKLSIQFINLFKVIKRIRCCKAVVESSERSEDNLKIVSLISDDISIFFKIAVQLLSSSKMLMFEN